ncbi:MAG: hypothetical protein P4N59_26775 [Negativicutes bacterium]|nr:hypothetical protein [Negativicutes bacterium]
MRMSKPVAVFLVLFFSFIIIRTYYDHTDVAPKTAAAETELRQELGRIYKLPGADFVGDKMMTKNRFITFFYNYTTDNDWDEFCRFYSAEMNRNGWVLKRDRILEGTRSLEYVKKEYYLRIGYNLVQKPHGYSIVAKWDYDEKDKNYLLP